MRAILKFFVLLLCSALMFGLPAWAEDDQEPAVEAESVADDILAEAADEEVDEDALGDWDWDLEAEEETAQVADVTEEEQAEA